MRILSAHHINNRFTLISKRASSVPEQCTNYCRNAQTECQQTQLTPSLCEVGSNFLDQYALCQSCIEDNSPTPDMVKTSLLLKYLRCTGYCSFKEPQGQGGGQDRDPATTTTKAVGSSSSSAVQTGATTTVSVERGQRTRVTESIPTTKPTSPPNDSPSPTISTATVKMQPASILTRSSTPTSTTSFNILLPSQSLTAPTQQQLTPSTNSTSTSQATPASDSSGPKPTAPWVWAIVSITLIVVFLLSCGSFLVFYKRGRSKRARARQRGMKGMVELKETSMNGWVESRSTSRSRDYGGMGVHGVKGMVTELDTVRDAYEMETGRRESRMFGRGGGVGRGGGTRWLPVELSSVSACVELPTGFNKRESQRVEEEKVKAEKEGWVRETKEGWDREKADMGKEEREKEKEGWEREKK
ncbi:hypothetical protein B0T20DRAFT_357153 [Sordaria brevicollis]|uniref:Uncharacterized protein n=1 Tax=Sordaria brevicollis TaxID=83679 RepID=A0AAE0UAG9_SORBR|nr:hypothetical protein B0T20DRAFT_357153 [Sordaria brevicollis]